MVGCSWVQKPTDHGLGTLGWCLMCWFLMIWGSKQPHFRWTRTTFYLWFSRFTQILKQVMSSQNSQNSCFQTVFTQAHHIFRQGTCGAELSAQGLFGAPNTTDLWSSWLTAYYGGSDEIAQHRNIVPWSCGRGVVLGGGWGWIFFKILIETTRDWINPSVP